MSNATVSQLEDHSNKPPSIERPTMSSEAAHPGNEFDYRPVPVLAPTAAALGVAAAATFISVYAAIFGVVAVVLGGICYRNIQKSNGELGGKAVALVGIFLGLSLSTIGSALHAYDYVNELPEGHLRVHFPNDISRKQFVMKDGVVAAHPDVEKLLGKKIFIKGWMYQQMQIENIDRFQLLKDSGECCFGGSPKPYDVIIVNMAEGLTTRSYSGMIAVAGTLRFEVTQQGPTYFFEATECGPARTSF